MSCVCCSFSAHRDQQGTCRALESLCYLLLSWPGRDPPTAPVALTNPFSICTHLPFPFPPLAQGFHPEGGYSGNGYIMAIISVLAEMDFPKSRQAGRKRNVFLTACDSGNICQSVLFFFTLEAEILQPTQALCPEEK